MNLMMDIFLMINLYINLIIICIYYGRNGFINLKLIILFKKKHKKILKVNRIILIYLSNLFVMKLFHFLNMVFVNLIQKIPLTLFYLIKMDDLI